MIGKAKFLNSHINRCLNILPFRSERMLTPGGVGMIIVSHKFLFHVYLFLNFALIAFCLRFFSARYPSPIPINIPSNTSII